MARTGWCRECGEWVWLDEGGACPNGHGSECVEAVHEGPVAEGEDSAPDAFGVGDMPASLDRFNWGAFFLMPLWGIVYGSSAVLGWWLVGMTVTLLIASLIGETSSASAIAGASSASSVVEVGIRLWAGMNANRWLWKRDRMRMEALPGLRPRFSVTRFSARQMNWLIAGAIVTAFSIVGLGMLALSGDAVAVDMREQLALTPDKIGVAALWVFAEVALAVWLAAKMRKDSAAPLDRPDLES